MTHYSHTSDPKLIPLELLPKFVDLVQQSDNNIDDAIHGTTMIRLLLSVEDNKNARIDAVVASGVVPSLVHLMSLSATPRLELEASWALTNISSGSASHTCTD